MRAVFRLAVFLLVCASLASCDLFDAYGIRDNWTVGERGKLRFSWATGWECMFGCALDRALMVGTFETLKIHPDDLPASAAEAGEQIAARSGDPQVVDVEVMPVVVDRDSAGRVTNVVPGVRVHAKAAGTAEIRVDKPDGTALDRVVVHVDEAARIVMLTGDDTESSPPLDLRVNGEVTFNARAFNADDEDLSASFGWTFSVDDPSVAALWSGDLEDPNSSVGELADTENFATVLGRAVGDTVLEARVVGAAADVEVRVRAQERSARLSPLAPSRR